MSAIAQIIEAYENTPTTEEGKLAVKKTAKQARSELHKITEAVRFSLKFFKSARERGASQIFPEEIGQGLQMMQDAIGAGHGSE